MKDDGLPSLAGRKPAGIYGDARKEMLTVFYIAEVLTDDDT